MILLPLINLIIFIFILICFIINYLCKSNLENDLSIDDEQENITFNLLKKRLVLNVIQKFYKKIQIYFQIKDYSYKKLYRNFFSAGIQSAYPFQTSPINLSDNKENYSQTKFSYEGQNDLENNPTNNLFFKTTLTQINHQHSVGTVRKIRDHMGRRTGTQPEIFWRRSS